MSTPQQPGWYWLGNKPEHIEAVCTSRTGGPAVTESEWLALLKEKPREADAVVADALGHVALARAIREGQPLPCDTTGRYASGDSWALFGETFDALPSAGRFGKVLQESEYGALVYGLSSGIPGTASGPCRFEARELGLSRNAAVATALLKVFGIIVSA